MVVTQGGGLPLAPWTRPELRASAGQASVALEMAPRRRDAERLMVCADRDRIARDLHDLVIQRLFATGMQLESVSRLVSPREAAARMRRAVDELDTTIREIRSTIYALHSGEQTPATLRTRVLEVVDAGTEQLGFSPDLRLSGLLDTAVPPVIADHLLAVLREVCPTCAARTSAERLRAARGHRPRDAEHPGRQHRALSELPATQGTEPPRRPRPGGRRLVRGAGVRDRRDGARGPRRWHPRS